MEIQAADITYSMQMAITASQLDTLEQIIKHSIYMDEFSELPDFADVQEMRFNMDRAALLEHVSECISGEWEAFQ